MVWPDNVIRQFQMVPKYPQQNDFHGPYNKLLCTLFPADSEYTVIPPFPEPGSSQASEWIVTTDVVPVDKPILILQLKKPGDLDLVSARELADFQIRQRMADLRANCPLPTLHAISAMGTALCFYSLETQDEDAEIMPLSIARHPTRINDTAPEARWNRNLLSADGEKTFRAVVDEIKQACENF